MTTSGGSGGDNLDFRTNPSGPIDDAYGRYFHRNIQPGIVLHAVLSPCGLWLLHEDQVYLQIEAQHLHERHRRERGKSRVSHLTTKRRSLRGRWSLRLLEKRYAIEEVDPSALFNLQRLPRQRSRTRG
jgi:hypothetical protein